jgi:putative DNA primase/helicase
VVERVVSVPVFAPNGEWQSEPGYFGASRTFYVPVKGYHSLPLPEHPSAEEVNRAVSLLSHDLLGDFPFTGDAERAHALSAIVTPFVRSMIDGPTPLHLIEKSTPGTGASLLGEAVVYVSMGRPAAMMTEGRDEDEWRKRITAKLATGAAVILIDNVRRPLESAALASALTADVFEDRRLGHTQVLRLPVRCVWLATGNNPVVSEEITRRIVRIRLDAGVERPWLRTGFRHSDLKAWVREQHSELVWAVGVLVRAWLAAGRPESGMHLGMFEQWAHVVGGILSVAGVPGFLGNLEEFNPEADAQGSALRALVHSGGSTYQDREVTTSLIWHVIQSSELPIDLGSGNERSQTSRLGRLLVEMRERVIGNYRVIRGNPLQGRQRWRLAATAKPETES